MTEEDLIAAVRELQRKVDELESIKEIEQLQQQYVRDLADRNWAGVATAYADDAVCDIRLHGKHKGRDAIAGMFKSDLQDVVKSRDGYVLSSPSITVSGDAAYGEWTWHRMQCEFRTSFGMMRVWGPWTEGKYKCHYARINGEWKIKDLWFRVLRPDSDDELAALPADGVIGGGYLDRDTASV
jgi:ketosteroid isomerase-like protein